MARRTGVQPVTRACYALDVGGTKIAAALVAENGDIVASTRRATEAPRGGAFVMEAMASAIDELSSHAAGLDVIGIGISAAGVIDPHSAVVLDATDAMPGWKGQNLGHYFSTRYHLPIAAANDVHCALLGELWRNPALAGMGGSVAMLAIGTGLGGALASGGRLQAGHHGLAGHFGRTLVWDALAGQLVTLDQLVSGTGLGRLYKLLAPSVLAADGAAVMALAASGDSTAKRALDAWLDHLALLLHNLYWSLDPELLLIGGGVIDARATWWDPLIARLTAHGAPLRVAPAALGSNAGVIGAARLAWIASETE